MTIVLITDPFAGCDLRPMNYFVGSAAFIGPMPGDESPEREHDPSESDDERAAWAEHCAQDAAEWAERFRHEEGFGAS